MIYISAGHHQTFKGARHLDFWEYDEALLWRDEIVGNLGVNGRAVAAPPSDLVFLTEDQLKDPKACRRVETDARLYKLSQINKAEDARLAVEVHFNSLDTTKTLPSERGCLTYYYPGSQSGRRMAQQVQEVQRQFFAPDLGAHEGYVQMNKSMGVIWFLALTKCPALIIEPQFIDRKEDIQAKRHDCCVALANVFLEMHEGMGG